MPRSATKPYAAAIEYFKTAPVGEAAIILDIVTTTVRERQREPQLTGAAKVFAALDAAPQPAIPVQGKPKPAAKAKPAPKATAAAADKPAKKKPGPKPGSRRKKAGTGSSTPDAVSPVELTGGELPPGDIQADTPVDPAEFQEYPAPEGVEDRELVEA